MRVKGKGFPVYKQEGKYSDLLISVIVDIPTNLDKEDEILIKKREIEDEKSQKSRIISMSIITILILIFATAYFLSRKVYLDKQMIIANQNEKIALTDLEHKKRELASISTNIVQENEQISNILKDLKYYTSLLNVDKEKTIFNPLIKSIKMGG